MLQDIFGYDDDDDEQPVLAKVTVPVNDNNNNTKLYDSDEEDDRKQVSVSRKHLVKKVSRSIDKPTKSNSSTAEFDDSEDDDVKATVDDHMFIDSDEDEIADIVKEYNSEKQVFHDDERPKKRKGEYADDDGKKSRLNDPLSLTLEDMKQFKPIHEAGLPASLARKLGVRGPQKAPTKVRVSLRLSREVVEYFRAMGEGWQTRMDRELLEMVHRHKAS